MKKAQKHFAIKLPRLDAQTLKALLPYIAIALLATKLGQAYRMTSGADVLDRLLGVFVVLGAAFQNPLPSLHPFDLLTGAAAAGLVRLTIYCKAKNRKKYRHGAEYGTARWGGPKDIAPFINSDFSQNILLTDTERLTLGEIADPEKRNVNLNVLVIGGSGSGKTRYHIKPNLLQMNGSYVCSDPKGTVVEEVGRVLMQKGGYKLKILNTIDFSASMHYNPFCYLHSETDILSLVTVIMENTQGKDNKGGEDFWRKAEALLYQALIAYIYYEAPAEEKNMSMLLDMLNACECREDDENFKSAVDLLFERLQKKSPNHFAVRQYVKFKMAAGKTAKSILISCGARLAPFDIKELRDLMAYDEMELDTIGDKKTALFLIMSDTDSTFNFVIAILQSQLTNLLCDKADDVYGGRLPVHVRFILDEFANIGQIPQFDKLIATIRSREISASIILQSQSQLKAIYRDNADTIVGNCDTMLFLGGKEKTTLKEISEILGKETIDSFNTSENRGKEISHGLNYQKLGKDLMTQDEIATMDGGMCILQLRGVRPFFSKKYDITKHPRYKYLSDADKKNTFDVERYIRVQRKKKKHPSAVIAPEEPFDLYEIELSDEDTDLTATE